MRNRLFLLALVAVLLLAQAILRTAAQATPFSSAETWGGYSFWELRGALPLGFFAAGFLLVITAAACQCLYSALQLSNHAPRLQKHAGLLTSACLWCGIPAVACCLNSLPQVFDWLRAYSPSSWQTQQHLEWTINASMLALIFCRVLSQVFPHRITPILTLTLPLLSILALGQIGFNMVLLLIPCAIMSAAGALMLTGRGKSWAAIPLLTAVIMNAYLFILTAPESSAIPAAAFAYTGMLLLLFGLLLLKLAALRA